MGESGRLSQKTRRASEAELFAGAKKHAEWFLQGGTTTVEAKSGYGLTLEDELKILRVIRRLDQETSLECVPTFLGAHAVAKEYESSEYVDLVVNEMLPRVTAEKLAEFCDVFCERGYFDLKQSRRILTAAARLGLRLRAHVDQLTNSGGAGLMAELKAATADHLEKTDQQRHRRPEIGRCSAGASCRDRSTRWDQPVIRGPGK